MKRFLFASLIFVMGILFVGINGWAEGKEQKGVFHVEEFFGLDGTLGANSVFLFGFDLVFAPGAKRWVRCNPRYDPECTEKNAPRFAFLGIGLGVTIYKNYAQNVYLRFPLVKMRIARNLWLDTGIGVPLFSAKEARQTGTVFYLGLTGAFVKNRD